MKRRRRVEIEIERREVSIFFGPAPAMPSGAGSATPDFGIRTSNLSPVRPAMCPKCGGTEMLLLGDPASLASQSPETFKQGVESGRIHLHCSPTGDWWLCGRSMQPG